MKTSLRRLALMSLALLAFPAGAAPQSSPVPPTMIPGFYDGKDANTVRTLRGESVFYQRCSFCHLPRVRKAGTTPGPAPALAGVLKGATPGREALVRDYILKGSDRMPGWQYGLSSAQLDDLLIYLKTL